ncbi:MAG: amidase family protein [Lautropia sp.]
MAWRALTISHREWVLADRARTVVRNAWHHCFARWDVVVCPVMPLPALPHDPRPMQERTVRIGDASLPYERMSAWAGPATMAGLPAAAMPIGVGAAGLPVGVQAIGAQFDDRTTIAFARLCGEAFGGFVAPPSCRDA